MSGYRYGFNGKENDNEVKGDGNEQDYGMRIYDTRLGRFLSVDPVTKNYPMLTPYQFASNRPIDGIDQDGKEFLSNGAAMFYLSNGQVLLKNENVPDVYRYSNGQPRFDAAGVGVTNQGIPSPPSNYVELRQGGFNDIPTSPAWIMGTANPSFDKFPKSLYRYTGGTSYYAVSSGVGETPFSGSTPLNTLNTGIGGVIEAQKYYKMFQDCEDWDAKTKLNGQIETFDKVVKLVDRWITEPNGLNSVDAFAKGQFNRDQLINFVMDGSLPCMGGLDGKNNIDGMLNLMFYGLQLIDINQDQYNNGEDKQYLWSGGVHRTHVSDASLQNFEFLIEAKKVQIGKKKEESLGSYSELLNKLKNE